MRDCPGSSSGCGQHPAQNRLGTKVLLITPRCASTLEIDPPLSRGSAHQVSRSPGRVADHHFQGKPIPALFAGKVTMRADFDDPLPDEEWGDLFQ